MSGDMCSGLVLGRSDCMSDCLTASLTVSLVPQMGHRLTGETCCLLFFLIRFTVIIHSPLTDNRRQTTHLHTSRTVTPYWHQYQHTPAIFAETCLTACAALIVQPEVSHRPSVITHQSSHISHHPSVITPPHTDMNIYLNCTNDSCCCCIFRIITLVVSSSLLVPACTQTPCSTHPTLVLTS